MALLIRAQQRSPAKVARKMAKVLRPPDPLVGGRELDMPPLYDGAPNTAALSQGGEHHLGHLR